MFFLEEPTDILAELKNYLEEFLLSFIVCYCLDGLVSVVFYIHFSLTERILEEGLTIWSYWLDFFVQ